MAAAVGRIGGIFGPLLIGTLLAAGYGFGLIFGIFCGANHYRCDSCCLFRNGNETDGVGMNEGPASRDEGRPFFIA